MCGAPSIKPPPPPPPAAPPPPVLEQLVPASARVTSVSKRERKRGGLSRYKIQPNSGKGPSRTTNLGGIGTKTGAGM